MAKAKKHGESRVKKEGASGAAEEYSPKEGSLIWLAIAIIAGVALFAWIIKAYGPKDTGIPDEALVRAVIRGQFEALFEKDIDGFLSYYSEDFDNGDVTYEGKVEEASKVEGAEFDVSDFQIEFVKSGEDEAEVHFDERRGFASAYAYTYWRQRAGDRLTKTAVHQLGAFLLRMEGKDWRIICDRSVTLKQKEDAEHLMLSTPFRPFMNPAMMKWPPDRIVDHAGTGGEDDGVTGEN
jgi:hypothetical protein